MLGFSLDLSSPLRSQPAWAAFEEKVLKNPHLTALINNAGIYRSSPFLQTTEEEFLEQLQVNFLGAVRLLKEVWPVFLEKEKAFVVNVRTREREVKPEVRRFLVCPNTNGSHNQQS